MTLKCGFWLGDTERLRRLEVWHPHGFVENVESTAMARSKTVGTTHRDASKIPLHRPTVWKSRALRARCGQLPAFVFRVPYLLIEAPRCA